VKQICREGTSRFWKRRGMDRASLSGHSLREYPDGQWMARYMKRNGHRCGRHRVRRLMRLMRLVPIYQAPNTSKTHPQHKIWPYLLRNMAIDRPNQVLLSGSCCA